MIGFGKNTRFFRGQNDQAF